jgi:Reverse transcriptase (RNA-dependent DNA polymerase)
MEKSASTKHDSVRGDMQVKGEDFFESYAPVVQWSSVRLMLNMSIVHGLQTRQVDYVNAFAQADLKEDVAMRFHSNVSRGI